MTTLQNVAWLTSSTIFTKGLCLLKLSDSGLSLLASLADIYLLQVDSTWQLVACYRRLSSVLKHKKPPKRGGRKSSKSDPVASSSSESMESYSPLVDPYTGVGRGSMAAELTPPLPRGKWSSGGKSSFLAGFHPSRWGRASSTGPERPTPPTVSLHELHSTVHVSSTSAVTCHTCAWKGIEIISVKFNLI